MILEYLCICFWGDMSTKRSFKGLIKDFGGSISSLHWYLLLGALSLQLDEFTSTSLIRKQIDFQSSPLTFFAAELDITISSAI